MLVPGCQGVQTPSISLWEVYAEVRKKFPVQHVSETQRGVCHIIILSWDASYGGVDVLPPGR